MARPSIDAHRGIEAMRERLAEIERMEAAVNSEYTYTRDDEHRARFGDVMSAVAARLQVQNNPAFRRNLKACLVRMGWRYTNFRNRKLWIGARHVSQSNEAAREEWRELRAEIELSSGPRRRAVLRRKGLL